MKKIILSLIVLSCISLSSAYADDDSLDKNATINSLIKYNDMEKQHTNDWLDYANQTESMKLDILKKHHSQRFDLHHKKLEMVRDQGFGPNTLSKGLRMLLSLRKRQAKDWKMFHKASQRKAFELMMKQNRESDDFEDSLD